MNESKLYRRILRRERHRSRSLAVAVTLVIVTLVALYIALECVLAALAVPALLVSPAAALRWATAGSVAAISAAIAAVVLGVIVLLIALTPGRRARHAIPHERMAVIVDDGVLAGAVAREVREVTQLGPDRVRAAVSARRTRVFVQPTSGIPVDAVASRAAVESVLGALDPRPSLRATMTVAPHGVVGA